MSSKKRQGQFFYIVKSYTAKEKPQAALMTCLRITGRHRLNGDFSFGLKKYCAATAKTKSRMSLKKEGSKETKK